MLLGSTKEEIDRLLGKPIMHPNLLGLNHAKEKTFAYPQGAFDVVVGYFGDVARTMAVVRKKGPLVPLTPAELSSALALNAPATLWTIETAAIPTPKPRTSKTKQTPAKSKPRGPTTYFSYVERDPKIKDKVTRELFGFMPGNAPYAFFYLPVLEGHPHVLPSEWAVDNKL